MLSLKRYQQPKKKDCIKPQIVLKSKEQFGNILKNFFNLKKRDLLAENIFWHDLRSMYYGKLAHCKGNKAEFLRKLHTDGIHLKCIKELADKYGVHHKTVRKKIKMFEDMGVLLRGYDHKGRSVNHPILYILKYTPFYYNPYGTTLKEIGEIKNHTGVSYTKVKYGIDRVEKIAKIRALETTAIEGGGVRAKTQTDNPSIEEISPKDISSIPAVSVEQNKKTFSVVKNECVETSQKKATQQKSSLEDDFVANTENLERDWELEYSDTALPEPPEYVLEDSGLARGEFNYGHLPPEPIESVETSIASDYVLGSTTPKTEEKKRTATPPIKLTSINKVNKTKEKKPMAISQTKLEPRQELNCQILKTFPTSTAEELQQKLDIKPIAPNKIGLAFKQGLELSNDEKQRLRETIRLVYGDSVKMVLVKPDKPKMATKEDTAKRSKPKALTPEESKWEAVKNDVLDSLFADQKKYYQSYFARAEVISLDGRKLKLQAKWDVCEKMKEKQMTIEQMAAKHDVDIEVKNLTDQDTLYLPFVKPNLNFLEK